MANPEWTDPIDWEDAKPQSAVTQSKRFTVFRPAAPDTHDANQKNAPDEPQFEGVIFSDGKVALRWLTACRSVSVWDSFSDMMSIHGHPEYGTYFVWHDGEPLADAP